MFSMKKTKTRFSSYLRAKVKYQGPPGAAGAQPGGRLRPRHISSKCNLYGPKGPLSRQSYFLLLCLVVVIIGKDSNVSILKGSLQDIRAELIPVSAACNLYKHQHYPSGVDLVWILCRSSW